MSKYKILIGSKSHKIGERKAKVLKMNEQFVKIIILNSAWKNEWHFIIEEIDGMTAIKSEHRVINKEEMIKEFNGDISLVEEIISELSLT